MIEYHPMGEYEVRPGMIHTLFVQTGCDTMEQALRVIKVWRDDYKFKITKAWIDVHEDKQIVRTIDIDIDTI